MDDIDGEDWEVFFRVVAAIVSDERRRNKKHRREQLRAIALEYDCLDDIDDLLAMGDPSL